MNLQPTHFNENYELSFHQFKERFFLSYTRHHVEQFKAYKIKIRYLKYFCRSHALDPIDKANGNC